MAEEFQRSRLYEYKQNSNLVLEADKDQRLRRAEAGTGEVETLHGKLTSIRMGDRINHGASNDIDSSIEKMKAKRSREDIDGDYVEKKSKNKDSTSSMGKSHFRGSALIGADDVDNLGYTPKTRESKAAYEEILTFVSKCVGDQSTDIIRGAADETIALLKDDGLRDSDKHKEIGKILSSINADKFNKLVNLGKRITDFHSSEKVDDEEGTVKMDEDMGVSVVVDDDLDELKQSYEEVNDDESEDDEGGVEAYGSGMLKGEDTDRDMLGEEDSKYYIAIHDIDAHWLQRQLSKFYTDANLSSKAAEEILTILRINDERSCENKLVVLLDFDKFEFIKLLLKNRAKIYYCSRIKQAQNDDERASIEKEMMSDFENGGPQLLEQLHKKTSAESWTQDRLGKFAIKSKKGSDLMMDGDSDGLVNMTDDNTITHKDSSDLTGSGKLLDLDSLTFQQGSHLMTNNRCELPDKSWRAQKKGYEEVHVPAIRPIISQSERLKEVSDMPEWSQAAFAGIKQLNRVQSKMFDSAFYSSENLLLCAPTGAGKTNVALLCMLHEIGQHIRSDGKINLNEFKIVYVAPMKALVQECVQNFGKKLAPYGISVRELSGDQNLTRQQIQDTQVIITTPEKWDIITRKAGDRTYTQLVRLMIIDEIHLLHDDRGPVLESLVARTIRQIETTQEMVRLVGLSATLPNYEDVASFLRVTEKGLFFFDSSYRPVPLQQQYIGITEKKALKRFQLMNEICYEKVLQQAGKNQILIFTHSRADTAKTAKALRDMVIENDTSQLFVRDDSASKEILSEESEAAKNQDLKDLLPFGFAVHHAGLVRSDRTLVEDLFSDKHIQVLVCTATLAWGVNLPCHTVILKGTQMYSPEEGRWTELSPLDIMQMMGRAGRYGLDSEGEGIIMTNHSELQYYLSLMNQQLPIESQLVKKLPDMLNAEIVLGSISSLKEAASWLGYTYLYIRMLKNPSVYGIPVEEVERDPSLHQRRVDLVHSAASILDKHNLIKYDRKSGNFQVTTLGRVASHYYVSHESMSIFDENLKPTMTDIEVFRLFSLSGEFKNIHVREEEKLELTKLVTRVPIPIKESIDEPSAKVNVLLQAYISRLKLEGFALIADMAYIQQSACRLMRALFEVALKRGWASLVTKTLSICKMVEKKTWASQSPLRQFSNIPEVIARKLEKNSDIPWERYYDLKAQDLGEMVKIPKMGKTLYKYVHMFPKLELRAQVLPITRSLLKVDLNITPDFQFDSQVHDFNQLFWIIVEDVNGEKILHHENFSLTSDYASEDHLISFIVPIFEPFPVQYFVKIISDRWIHSETTLPLSFRNLLLPSKFPPPTELLDLQPLPVTAIKQAKYHKLYSHLRQFNPILTQTFSALCEADENVLVCAPSGSSISVCAEFAIIRALSSNPSAVCVYVACKQEVVDEMYRSWTTSFGDMLGVPVVKLKGDVTSDMKLMDQGQIVVSTACNWDSLSRRWKQRKQVQNVSLHIFDDLHLLGSADGPTLEIVISRVRYMASQLEKSVRVVCLSSSLANAKDVGDWIGAPQQSIFNFAPSVRPIPLELQLQGFEINHFGSRVLAMSKPTYNAIYNKLHDGQCVIFVPSRKQAHLVAIDIMSYSSASKAPRQFLKADENLFGKVLSTIKEPSLAQTLGKGIGFLDQSLCKSDRDRVEALYRDGVISILIVPQDLCWVAPRHAHLVIVMDTTYYEGKEHRFVDYSITNIMRMVGTSCKPAPKHESSCCVILCHAAKKEYLKKLLNDPLPVESHLDHFLHDHFNAEIVSKTIETKQDAVDYLTWTFLYRRLTQNPNYYNMQGTTHRHLSDHLSDLVESTVNDLSESKCISVEDDADLGPLNLGMIASYYYIQYTTVEIFAASLAAKTKMKGVLEILSSSSEFSMLTIRQGEDKQLEQLVNHLPYALIEGIKLDDPISKVFILLQCHFSRVSLSIDLNIDLKYILELSVKLLQALIDVISSQGWLKPAIAAMELSQMIVQGIWDKASVLLQIPHMTEEIVQRCNGHSPPVNTVFDIFEIEDDDRNRILGFTPEQLSNVAVFCNSYPNIEVTFNANMQAEKGSTVAVTVLLQRDGDDDDDDDDAIPAVICPRFPAEKVESYWLVIGDSSSNSLYCIKRVSFGKRSKAKLQFVAPDDAGKYNLTLYLMSDSYLGCDQEFDVQLEVLEEQ